MDALEEEMSRFEQEVLGAASKPPPLMGSAPPLLKPPTKPLDTPRPLFSSPSSQTSSSTPRPLLIPAEASSSGPRPLMPASQTVPPGFVPRQAVKSSGGAGPPPLMGGAGNGPPEIPPGGPPRNVPLHNGPPGMPPPPGGPLRMPPPQSGPPGMPPPQNGPPGMLPPQNGPPGSSVPHQFPPQVMAPPPGPLSMFPPAPRPPLQTYTPLVQMPAPSATPLNPMAIAQAVAGATASSGMSASGAGIPLLPVPPMPPKKGLVGKQKSDPKKLRMGGGKVWEDYSLDDWDPNDFRIFVGDLGNDVNDDTLARSFSRFPSFLKAKVIRDKYSKKTKGYGFVSFKDPKDFMNAMREMNGRYIGNRPVKLRKSTWKDRQMLVVKKKEKEKKRLGFK